MKTKLFLFTLLSLSCNFVFANDALISPNGIKLPADYKNWKLISSSHREDSKTLRVILGNDTAMESIKQGKTNPWQDGSMLVKLVWKDSVHPNFEKATVPNEFVHSEVMVKDATKYAETGGWGYARWLGMEQKTYGHDASFVQECAGCHAAVKENDFVFTRPSKLP